jgi:hypothetical protein
MMRCGTQWCQPFSIPLHTFHAFFKFYKGDPYPCQLSDRKFSGNRYGGVETPCHYMIPCLLGVDNLEKVWKFLVAI